MKQKKISTKKLISTSYVDKESICYNKMCSCEDPEHNLTIILETEVDIKTGKKRLPGTLKIEFHSRADLDNYYFNCNLFDKVWLRIKAMFSILFTGTYKAYSEHVLFNKDEAQDFITALQEGIDYLE